LVSGPEGCNRGRLRGREGVSSVSSWRAVEAVRLPPLEDEVGAVDVKLLMTEDSVAVEGNVLVSLLCCKGVKGSEI
jgi:hypothetical protein